MFKICITFMLFLSSVCYGWEPHFHELQETEIKSPLGNPFGLVSVKMALDKPNGNIQKFVITSDLGRHELDISQFSDMNIVRLGSLSIVTFDLGIEEDERSFSACVRYGIGKTIEFAGKNETYIPVLGVRVTETKAKVFTLPIPSNNVQVSDADGCFYLSTW